MRHPEMDDHSKASSSRMSQLYHRLSYSHLAMAQGLYFFVFGLWPVFSIDTFMAVTGPKTEIWLVYTVGLLLAVIGAVLFIAGFRWRVAIEILLLAAGSAAVLAAIDILFVFKGRISPVYLLDAGVEIVFLALWAMKRVRGAPNPETGTLLDPALLRFGREKEKE